MENVASIFVKQRSYMYGYECSPLSQKSHWQSPLLNMLAINGEILSCSVDAGFVLALPLHHGDLELDSVGVLAKSYLKILLLLWYHGHGLGAYLRGENSCARTTCRGLICEGGHICGTLRYYWWCVDHAIYTHSSCILFYYLRGSFLMLFSLLTQCQPQNDPDSIEVSQFHQMPAN